MNIHEISASLDILIPWMFMLRLLAFTIGLGMFIHVICMAGFLSPKTPWSFTVLIALVGAAGCGMMLGSVVGDFTLFALSSIMGAGGLIGSSLWLWHQGFHVSKFIENLG